MAEVEINTNEQPAEVSPTLEDLKAELAKLREENGKLKNAQSNASADAAKWKKEAREKMDAQARAEAETKELIEQLKAENNQLKRNQEIADYTNGYMGLGFDAALAKKAADAFADHDFSTMATAMKDFITAHDKALQADALRATPRPGAGSVEQVVTKEQFNNMTYTERLKLFNENPELYQKLKE